MEKLYTTCSQCPIDSNCPITDKCTIEDIGGYQLAFENAPLSIGIFSLDGKFIHANKTYCTMLGRTLEELLKLNFKDVTHLDDYITDQAYAQLCISGKIDKYELNKRYIHKDGHEVWVARQVFLISRLEKPFYFIVYARDITESKGVKESLARSEARLQLAIEGAELGYWEWDVQNDVIRLSPQFLRILDYPTDKEVNTFGSFVALIHDNDKKKVIQTMQRRLEISSLFSIEFRAKAANGEYRNLLAKGKTLKSEEDSRLYAAGFIIDVTEDKNAENSLRVALDELKKTNADLEQFAYVASHDLQEPLRTVNSYVQLFSVKYNNQIDEKGKQYITFIVDATTRMRNLIKDLLEFSRSGKPAPKVMTSFHEVVNQALASLSSKIDSSKANIIYDRWTDTSLYGNPGEIARVIQNIVSNSIKFKRLDQKPVIKIGYEVNGDSTTISIKDNGVGIAKENYTKLFKMFYRIREGDTATCDGNGIGLAICKRIIDKHGGEITADSREGKGTKFSFTLCNKAG